MFPVRTTDVVLVGSLKFVDRDDLPDNEPRCGFKDDNPICIAERSAMPAGGLESAVIIPLFSVLAIAAGIAYAVRK